MEQLQRLAEKIADVYIRDLKRETGGDVLTVNGISGVVDPSLLASGLVDNVVYFSKGKHGDAYSLHAYNDMAMLINVIGAEYSLTPVGLSIINTLLTNALKKQNTIKFH